WSIGSDNDVPNGGMNSVGTNDRIALDAGSIRKCQDNLPSVLIEPDQLLIQMDNVSRERGKQSVMQIGTMHTQVWSAEKAVGHRQLPHDLSRISFTVQMGVWLKCCAAKPLLHTDAAQDLHGIRHHLNACTDSGELVSLFVDLHVDADLAQCGRHGQAAHSCS